MIVNGTLRVCWPELENIGNSWRLSETRTSWNSEITFVLENLVESEALSHDTVPDKYFLKL